MKKMFIIYLFCCSLISCDTLEIARGFSYEASVYYINRDFQNALHLYKKSLKIRKELNIKNEHYVTILKMFIYSQWRTNQFCQNEIESNDHYLLLSDNDSDFLYDLSFMNNYCQQKY